MPKIVIFGVVIERYKGMKKALILVVMVVFTATGWAQQSVMERIERQKEACHIDALNKGYVAWDQYFDSTRNLDFKAYLEQGREYHICFIVDPAYAGGELEVLTYMDKVYERVGAVVPVQKNVIQTSIQTPSNGRHYFRYNLKEGVTLPKAIYMCVLIFVKK